MCDAPVSPSPERDEYKAKRDAETLRDAEEIRSDKNRMTAAGRHLEHAVTALKSVSGKRGMKRKGKRMGSRG
jgi:hypothetical protein